MSGFDYTLLAVAALFWGAVVLLKAISLPRPNLSLQELERRSKGGDHDATLELWRLGLLPRLSGMRWLGETLASFFALSLLFLVLKPLSAVLAGLASLLLTDVLSRRPGIARLAGRWLRDKETGLLRWVEGRSWLDWFKRAEQSHALQVGSREELRTMIGRIPTSILSREERAMLTSQLDFSAHSVADVMTPHSMIESVNVEDTIGPLLLDRLHRSGHSRFPVIDGDIDHVVGILYLHELIGGKTAPATVKKAMKDDVFYIGEAHDLEHALHAFLRSHQHLFIVVNEFRETVGILSLEDVIESMIGRSIVDEFDEFDDLRSVAASNPKSNNVPKGKQDI